MPQRLICPTTMSYNKVNLQPTFKPIDNLFLDRLRHFIDSGGRYSSINLPKFYDYARVDSESDYIDLKVWRVPDDKDGKTARPLFRDIDFDSINWDDAHKGNSYGPSWKTFWFKIEWIIPKDWLLKNTDIYFDFNCDCEGFIYTCKGVPLQAFSGSERTIFNLTEDMKVEGKQRFYLEIACNGMFGNGDDGVPDENRYFRLSTCDLVLPDVNARKLRLDYWEITDLAREADHGATKFQAALVATKIMETFDEKDRSSILKCRKLAQTILGPDVDSDDVYHHNPLDKIDVYGVGNCHIDTAWLWPFAETRRKIVRSWTTQLKLAEEYPEYIFVASQMQQFKWLKQDHPDVLKRIKEKFTINQFLPIGGSWVEHDTNMPGGESLIRQFLLGQKWLIDEFGAAATIFWLPDTFGYSSQIPQVCQICGIDKFLTQKLSWNNINSFPLSTFNWKALDGSQVLVHMPPDNTYTAEANFGDVIRSLTQHKNLRDVPTGLLLFGHGDGGGGPKEEMLEKLRRCRGIANTTGAIPSVHLGKTVEDFYQEVLERSDYGRTLPTWTGEIYLEFHRGTYTTHADLKKRMRLSEIMIHDLELLATFLSVTTNYVYPNKEIHDLWEDIALCQFHDVLPGTCIGMVYYEEVYPMLSKVIKTLDELIKDALKHLDREGAAEIAAVNTLPWDRMELIEMSQSAVAALDIGSTVAKVTEGEAVKFGFCTKTNRVVHKEEIQYPASIQEDDGVYLLRNGLLEARITKNGVLKSLYDIKNDREVIESTKTAQSSGFGNQFVIFDDEPLSFPAWDTEIYNLNKVRFLSDGEVVAVMSNALESKLVVRHTISEQSSIETTISLKGVTRGSEEESYLRFACNVKWHEFYKFLKVQFPVTVCTPQFALYETQFGVTQRPTHWNTTWDIAKFEVCHHKFMDLSEHNYGVSILNNSKYGAAVHGNLMRLSLLRAPKAPDDKADMGNHHFEYALYPHRGPLNANVVRLAHNFNYKLLPHLGSSKAIKSLLETVTLSGDSSLVLSNIKRAEHDADINVYANIESNGARSKSIVVRVFESLGGASRGKLHFHGIKVAQVLKTNALEEGGQEVELVDGAVSIYLRSFEISTYKVVLSC